MSAADSFFDSDVLLYLLSNGCYPSQPLRQSSSVKPSIRANSSPLAAVPDLTKSQAVLMSRISW